jgi:hypothetical protein
MRAERRQITAAFIDERNPAPRVDAVGALRHHRRHRMATPSR